MNYSNEASHAIYLAWGKLRQWAHEVPIVGYAVDRAYTAERRQLNVSTDEAMLTVLRMFHSAWKNHDKPVAPSKLHTRAGLLRVYTATSKYIAQEEDDDGGENNLYSDKFCAGRRLVNDTIEPVLTMIDALHPPLTAEDVPSL